MKLNGYLYARVHYINYSEMSYIYGRQEDFIECVTYSLLIIYNAN